ncbi:MAG: D-alanyl-D-alanine carboxypeptidase/D-alanyl-D-alanine-endopeptidase [Planctomycetota bacterium]
MPMNRPLRTLTPIVVLFALTASALADLTPRIERLLTEGRLGSADVGVVIYDPQTDRVIGSLNADEQFVPASNMKLITSGAAITLLGADFAFETRLLWEPGARRLIVEGSGDPAFGDPDLLERMEIDADDLLGVWAEAVKSQGITNVRELVIDDRAFDREFVHPSWPRAQLNRWYCAEVAGLNFHTNVVHLYMRADADGQPPSVRPIPEVPGVRVTNRAGSIRRGNPTVWAARPNVDNHITLRGDVRGTPEALPVTLHDMPARFGDLLAGHLREQGISVGSSRTATTNEAFDSSSVLHVVRTPLQTVLERTNVDSHNLYAECLLKALGRAVTGQPGSWSNGAAVVRMELVDALGPMAGRDAQVADGSGMSRENRLTPSLVARWLDHMHDREELGEAFRASLASPGRGTLSKRFKKHPIDAHIEAKTGYLNGVSAISGYLSEPHTGKTVIFSIMVNEKPDSVPLRRVFEFQERVIQAADEWLTERAVAATPKFGG